MKTIRYRPFTSAALASTPDEGAVIDWLLAGDPAIAWQTRRDLLDQPAEVYELERALVSTTGWGRRLLDHQDADGTWGGGLSRFDGKRWTQYTVSEGLPGNHVFMLHVDPKGTLWVGTNNGLARMKDGGFDVLTTQDGLFNNAVFSMTTARDGTLWVGSFGGVAKIKPS